LVIQAKVEDYLGSGSITSLSQSIGKIYPKEIKATALSSPLQIYMDEPFDLGMTIQALGQAGNVLLNYDATMYPVDAISLHAENNDDGNDLSARLSGLAGTWVKGVFQSAAGDSNFADIEFSRPTVANLAASGGPYNNLSLGVSVAAGAEAGVIVGDVAADMNAAAAGCGGGCDAVTIKSGARINYARLAAMPSQGAENKSLDIPLVLEVWDGTHFVRNMSDNTTLVSDAVTGAPTFSNYTENLSAGELLLSQVPAAGLSFTAGAVPPGAGYRVDNTVGLGNWGSVTATFGGTTVVDWLRFDWDGNAATADTGPSSTHTYGNYRGSDKVIHWQER
jgi:MSHA biogenesis protein MshQ